MLQTGLNLVKFQPLVIVEIIITTVVLFGVNS